MRSAILYLFLGLVLASCSSKKEKEEPGSEPPKTERAAHALAGDWSATVALPKYGSVVASAVVEANGEGVYIVTLKGVQKNGVFRILEWDEGKLAVEVEGQRFEVYAHLEGHSLDVEAPGLGTAVLTRNP